MLLPVGWPATIPNQRKDLADFQEKRQNVKPPPKPPRRRKKDPNVIEFFK